MKKQKIGERPRPLYQRMLWFTFKTSLVGLAGIAIYSLYLLVNFWQLERRSAELPGLHLYSVQESNYSGAFSWYASYPKMDEPAFDGAVAKIANDAKGTFLARVNFQAKTDYPQDDLNVSYSVDSYDADKLSVALTSRQSVRGTRTHSIKKLVYDRRERRVESVTAEKEPPHAKGSHVVAGEVPAARRSGTDCSRQKCVALTFNDGPSPVTPQILDVLKSSGAKATFFEVGAQAKLYPHAAKRTVGDGHVVGSLGFNHLNMATTPLDEMVDDINQGEGTIEKAGGARPGLLRAAYGSMTKELAGRLGMPIIGWNIDPKDDVRQSPESIYKGVMSKVGPGKIVVSRDTQQATADAYGRIIPDLIKQGYELVTVPQLLGFKGDERPGMYGN